MKYYSQYRIHDLFELQESLLGLSKSNRWVKLADRLPWTKIGKEHNKRLRNSHCGAGNKPARMVVGALIVKHMENLSDEKTILAIQENPYMQYLLGLSKFTEKPVFVPRVVRFDPQAPWPGLLQYADLDTGRSGREQAQHDVRAECPQLAYSGDSRSQRSLLIGNLRAMPRFDSPSCFSSRTCLIRLISFTVPAISVLVFTDFPVQR